MDVEITKSNGTTFRLSDYGVVKDFVVESISLDEVKETGEGMNGFIDYGSNYRSRRIVVPMIIKSDSLHGFALTRDELYRSLTDVDSYYVREMRRVDSLQYDFVDFGEKPKWSDGTENKYIGGKRFKVRMVSTLSPDQIKYSGEISIEFETTELPFAESIGTSMDLHRDGMDASKGIWGAGMNLMAEDLKYTFRVNKDRSFDVYNPSDIEVTPWEHDLKITISRIIGVPSGSHLQLTNNANGSRLRAYGGFDSVNSVLVYDGPEVKLNGAQALRRTRRDFITLAPGWNNIKLFEASTVDVELDFRFYYK